MRGKFITSDQAVKGKKQHTKPCSDCPWRRDSIRGWLGPGTVDEWLTEVQSDNPITCHVINNMQCAGSAIFRGNICKVPRDPNVLVLPSDRKKVLGNWNEFREHHTK